MPTVKTHQSAGVTTHFSIDSAERVAWCNIETEGLGLYKGKKNIHAISISTQRADHWFPCFWLPWGGDKTYKVTLVDKRPFKVGGEPKIFLTAAVDGCSVFVEGTEEEPTVYHANAMGQNPSGFDLNTQRYAVRVDRSMLMRDRLLAIPEPKRGTGSGLRVAEGGDYMIDFLQALPPQEEQRLKDEAAQWLRKKKIQPGQGTAQGANGAVRDMGIQVEAHQGTVFGVKKNKRWSFYYQRRVSMKYSTPKSGRTDLSKTKNWNTYSMWLSAEVVKFWPTGGNEVPRITPLPNWPG
ncbi:hypothetical protein D187_003275 [Cystobacter fuscus DSM 2262]|uniref:Uncharacterized protein n=2 Tax=Cystobacter fuscus TaxID=43 RepID=S9QTC0_CYSF2|nr:hypothetical protein D187_003275 [Cystobacter fuscus DSM 2262]